MQILPRAKTDRFAEWLDSRNGKCTVAGPCSVETDEQIWRTALALAPYGVTLLRGGIWKPRTRPDSFAGVGSRGLAWLKAAGDNAGLPVATEVACAAHVEQCLKADINVLWIGARTTTSPLAVQEIAVSLAGVDVPVMIKNPMNPDMDSWLGAIERILQAGIKRIVAVHRGFSTHTCQTYRYQPLWRLPLELRQRLPGIPLLCDPSHICGNRQYIASVAEDALELGFDGWMIESHWHPEAAWSDAKQQLTPDECGKLIQELASRCEEAAKKKDRIHRAFGKEIEEIDDDLNMLFARRLARLREMKGYHQEQNASPVKNWLAICVTRLLARAARLSQCHH